MSEEHHSINSHYYEKSIYELSPIARNTTENNRVQVINYRGIKLTSFNVDGRQLICLPQAFDYFLKHLVGGLHTVYTKLKRLEILPIICNVEQVRILRSLGAIQPGVNRCKLLAPHEFDILYDDCTNSGSRPGRPAKQNKEFLLQPTFPQLSFRTNMSRSFTVDAMLNTTRNQPTTIPMDFFHMKNIIDLTITNNHLRERQLENEILDLKNEINKEHEWKEKLQQDFRQLRRVRSTLIKKLKRLNRSNT